VSAAVVAVIAIGLALQTAIVTRTGFFMGDFRAFYCAARVTAQGANPYHTEPLRSCELGIGSTMFFEKNPGVAIPAPLPGYAMAALIPLSLLPFSVAVPIWLLLLLLAWLACIVSLARFAKVSWEVALAVFGVSLGVLSLPFGEVVPLALACICIAAYLVLRGRPRAAGIVAAGAMIEPHLGLPVCAGLAVWQPATRLPLAVSFCALGAASLAVLGPPANIEYFTSVLPAHALSELGRDTQLSLTAVLAGVGLVPGAAVRAGALWYLVMLVLGVAAAGMLAKCLRNDALVVCVPPAFAVFGGTFIHVTQVAAALPAAVLLANLSGKRRALAIVALLLLAVPWLWAISPALIVAPIVPAGFLAWRYWNESPTAFLVAAFASAAMLLGLSSLASVHHNGGAHVLSLAIDPNLAEYSWSQFTQQSSTSSLASWMLRLPTWLGLGLLLVLLGLSCTRAGNPARARAGASPLVSS